MTRQTKNVKDKKCSFFLLAGNFWKWLTLTCFIFLCDFKTFKLKSKIFRCITFGTHTFRENKTTVNIKKDTEKN